MSRRPSASALPPPPTDIGVDLLGLDDHLNSTSLQSPGSNASTPPIGMTPTTSSDQLFMGGSDGVGGSGEKNRAPPGSNASSTGNLHGLVTDEGLDTNAPSGGYDGTGIGANTDDVDTTHAAMHSSNMGFFDRINKEGGGAAVRKFGLNILQRFDREGRTTFSDRLCYFYYCRWWQEGYGLDVVCNL